MTKCKRLITPWTRHILISHSSPPFPLPPSQHAVQPSPFIPKRDPMASAYFLHAYACIYARIGQTEYFKSLLMLSENSKEQRADICQWKAIYSIFSSRQACSAFCAPCNHASFRWEASSYSLCTLDVLGGTRGDPFPWKYPIDRAKVTTTSVREGVWDKIHVTQVDGDEKSFTIGFWYNVTFWQKQMCVCMKSANRKSKQFTSLDESLTDSIEFQGDINTYHTWIVHDKRTQYGFFTQQTYINFIYKAIWENFLISRLYVFLIK